MKLLQKILNKFNGLHFHQEYLCVGMETFEQPLHAYIFHEGRILKDISTQHCFVGYHPLILAMHPGVAGTPTLDIAFSNKALQPNGEFSKKEAIALLRLQKINEPAFGDHPVIFYRGMEGSHQFVSRLHQSVIGLNNRLHNKKKGNVFLHDNLYKQVQIAYALPRNISLVTVGHDNNFNLFPTDLHGSPGEGYYIISLRFSGKACRQVENTRKVLLSQVDSMAYKTVYRLGKNHMQDMKPKENFPFGDRSSSNWQLPIPEQAISCRELELIDSFIHGIHKLLFFKIHSEQILVKDTASLAHIHNTYATWRHRVGLPGNYLLR